MASLLDWILTGFGAFGAFLIVLGPIVIIHEAGHYLVAKLFNTKVLVFSVGFGRRLWGFERGGTDYRLSLLPLGGYVRLGGEYSDEASGDPTDMVNKPRWQRILIYLAGPGMNLFFSIALFTVLFMLGIGLMVFHEAAPIIGTVEEGLPAEKAGLREGDKVLAIDGIATPYFKDVAFAVSTAAERPVNIEFEREGEKRSVRVTPVKHPIHGDGDIGIGPRLALSIAEVHPGTPASRVDLREGDLVREVNGKPVGGFEDFANVVRPSAGKPVDIELLREGASVKVTVIPQLVDVVMEVGGASAAGPAAAAPGDRYSVLFSPTPPEDPRRAMMVALLAPADAGTELALGDVVREVAGQPVADVPALLAALEPLAGQPVALTLESKEGSRVVEVKPSAVHGRSQIGMSFGYSRKMPFFEALQASWELNVDVVRKNWRILELLAARLINPKDVLSGPLGIATFSLEAMQRGPDYTLYLIAMLSVSIGLMNLLPIPLLDGGHITTLTVESILRRDLSLDVKERLAQVGFMLLVLLMGLALIFDVLRQVSKGDDSKPTPARAGESRPK